METRRHWLQQLDSGLSALGLDLSRQARDRLLDYLALLAKWNRVYNLTAVRDARQMVGRHLLESLAILPHLHGRCVLDLGTGAGLPGVPLAIADPERSFTLIDSSGKKTRFVRQACLELGLANLVVVHERVEDYRPEALFDTVTARAFAPLAQLLAAATPLLAPGGRILAMKGPRAEAEVAAAGAAARGARILPLEIPDVEERRCLVVLAAA